MNKNYLKISLACFVICLVCLWLMGCTYCRPLNAEYHAILKTQQTSDMNCVDRGICYSRLLRSKGYKVRIISGHLDRSMPGINHLWIEHYYKGKWYNTEVEKRVDKVNDRTRELKHDLNITKDDVIIGLKQIKLNGN